MEATGSAALRLVPVGSGGFRRGLASFSKVRPRRVSVGGCFSDEGHLRYYVPTPVRCGGKKEKKREKLVKGLSRDLSEFYSMGIGEKEGEGMVREVKGKMITEAAELLLAQLNQLRAEAKETKRKRKQEKAAMKAARIKDITNDDTSSSSSSESSDSECETVVKVSSLRTPEDLTENKPKSHPDPMTLKLKTDDGMIVEDSHITLKKLEQECSSTCSSSSMNSAVLAGKTVDKIEVCMGGKCKKSGAIELLEEFERKVGIEGAVVGCKCMGKCRDGPNVRVVNQSTGEEGSAKVSKLPLCIGVGLEDVGTIVANFFGDNEDVGLIAA